LRASPWTIRRRARLYIFRAGRQSFPTPVLFAVSTGDFFYQLLTIIWEYRCAGRLPERQAPQYAKRRLFPSTGRDLRSPLRPRQGEGAFVSIDADGKRLHGQSRRSRSPARTAKGGRGRRFQWKSGRGLAAPNLLGFRFTAGASGFFVLSQSGDRPDL
jgi:hypothetical protein